MRGRLRVLVVEDSMLIALDIAEHVETWGHEVVGPFPSVTRALPFANREAVDAALLDINLGSHHCFPLAAILRGSGIPFLFLTGHDPTFIPDEFGDAPRLAKPVDFDELSRALERLANGTPARLAAGSTG
ncbi:MAG TPA: response regulator [Alphaproteobacteria bacterium]|jgi:DNA-binding response OmpR family regulator|nr:response regulator [Alphaproteobacteria bacterium]